MFYTYILKNLTTGYLYIGYSGNLVQRMKAHQSAKKVKLIYYESYLSEKDARKREKDLKSYGSALGHLKKRIYNSFLET